MFSRILALLLLFTGPLKSSLVFEIGLAGETVLQALGLDPLDREAFAIVGDLDDDVTTLVEGVQADRADLRLAGLGALGRNLEAVVGGVAHHICEWIIFQLQTLLPGPVLGALMPSSVFFANWTARI